MVRFFALIVVAIATLSIGLFSQEYNVDLKGSTLKWTGEKVTGKHFGTINIKDGSFKKEVAGFSGIFNIDMNSIKIDDLKDAGTNAKLLGHLKSDDFFSVEKFAIATFKLKGIKDYSPKKGEKGKHLVTGDLTIKGITNEISFPAEVKFDNKSFKADANFTINRAKWDIRYGSGSFFDNLGDKMIYDDIKFELKLVANSK